MSDAPAPDSPPDAPDRRPSRLDTPVLVSLVLLVVLFAGFALLGGGGSGGDDGGGGEAVDASTETTTAASERDAAEEARQVSPAHVRLISRRVEEIRGLRFKRPVRVEVLAPDEVEAFALRALARESPRAELDAAEEVGKLLGQLAPEDDMDRLAGAIYSEQVAGFYDPSGGRLVLVRGAGVDDATLAHELTHALEDQHFDLDRLGGRAGRRDDDASAAETALGEGTAMRVMTKYVQEHPDAISLGDALGSLGSLDDATALPPTLMRSLLFSYTGGERFVNELAQLSDGRWTLVDNALRHRPPVSTAEILDADRWLRVQRPRAVSVDPGAVLGEGWRRVSGSTLGEWDLGELLRASAGEDRSARLARGWAGGRYELWSDGPLPNPDCASPCRAHDAFTAAVRLDDAADARTVAAALAEWVVDELDGRRSADGVWRLPDGAGAAVAVRGESVRLAMAPSPALAARLARAA